ncbi:MAG: CPBP family intramembrane glutamic endopeptidase, partial [Longimicrobiales bacterium]|nr:CPBP family intramembrane glutamic endopeptidase [Longimicrobiales bacterium]
VGTGLAGVAVLVIARLASGIFGWRETRLAERLIPTTPAERSTFAFASCVSGAGEELAYRGFLLSLLVATFDAAWIAVLVSSLAFAILHAYQGPLGIVRTAVIGVIFAWAVLATGSVWPVVVGHIIINGVAGLVLGRWLLQRD